MALRPAPEPQRDSSRLAEFGLLAVEEIKSGIPSFGRKAVVLEPDALRREIAALSAVYAAPFPRDQPTGRGPRRRRAQTASATKSS